MGNNLRIELETLAAAIVKDATGNGTAEGTPALADRIDALKTLTTLYLALNKHPEMPPDELEHNQFNFESGIKAQETKPNGTSRVRTRPGN